ncbi:MAG: two-component system regulatory protein YycI [Schleiferilactobacillus perolens]|jgi:regulatory protein YycI of two-component signal transduction system YycFG|uniref:two-component system regulatory protein YycI n=1 Tax=Schleiferilactobacillus perolens TaxID=100468 RepID=UPI0039EA096C
MDFRKIEGIFLIVFIALDFFLFFSWQSNKTQVSSRTATTTPASFAQELREDNISIDSDQGTKRGSGYYLASRPNTDLQANAHKLMGQTVSLDSSQMTLISKLNDPFKVTAKNRKAVLQDWMKTSGNVLFANSYQYVPEVSDSSRAVFAQKVDGNLIMDSHGQLVFQIRSGWVTGYTQTYINDLIKLQEMDQTKSAQEAVMLLYTYSEIPTNSKILWEKLAYGWLLDAKGSTIYIPVWYVGIENRNTKVVSIKRVNAFTGAVLKSDNNNATASDSDD